MKKILKKPMLGFLVGMTITTAAWGEEGRLGLAQAIAMAQSRDPWMSGSQYTQRALEAEATAAGTLPDPRVSLTAANLPVDTFDTGQEAMTQFSVGITQMFPRGDSLALMEQRKEQLGRQQPHRRADREAKVAATVSRLWLDAYRAQQTIALIENDRALFEQLVDVAQVNYSSALGRARQQDVIRAQLELTRLDDRLTSLGQQMDASKQQLSEWLGAAAISQPLNEEFPDLDVAIPHVIDASLPYDQKDIGSVLVHHPAVKALDTQIDAARTGIDLVHQQYKPEWGVTAKYGYRGEDPLGRSRADLFSVGVTFDVPIFTEKRQDKEVIAAIARTEATRTDKALLLRTMMASLEKSRAELFRLDGRLALYSSQLLPQMDEQAEAALEAYNNDDGDFAEVVRAQIAELDAKIELLNISVERQKAISTINYYLASLSNDPDHRPLQERKDA